METFLTDVIINMIGAFFGFTLALLLQKHTENTNKKRSIELIITTITDELLDIGKSLAEYEAKSQILESKILIPAWEAALYTGKILELIENPMYNGIIRVYANINNLNETLHIKKEHDKLIQISQIIDQIEALHDI